MNVNETHEKIIGFLGKKGPSLPINVAKELKMSSLFISAFLSELLNEKRVKMSNLKVGGSSLYFLDGQEEQLESYYKFMHPKEAEVFLLLKENKILKDGEQDPAIRVALRSIRDFAVGFNSNDEIYWRYFSVPEIEANELISGKSKKIITEEVYFKKTVGKRDRTSSVSKEKAGSKPLSLESTETGKFKEEKEISKSVKIKKPKSKSEFVLKAIDFIKKDRLQIIDEKDYKNREYNCVIQIRSELGAMNFLTQAKDKKTISEADLMKLLSNAQSVSLPAFMLYTGDISKKGKEYLQKYKSILKAKKII